MDWAEVKDFLGNVFMGNALFPCLELLTQQQKKPHIFTHQEADPELGDSWRLEGRALCGHLR